jgi:hypothetical protein
MRKIDCRWKNLYTGYLLVRKAQVRLLSDWSRALKVAEKRKYLKERQKWLEALNIEKKRYRTLLIVSAILIPGLFACAIAFSLILSLFGSGFPAWGITFLIAVVLAGITIVQKMTLNNLENNPPSQGETSKNLVNLVENWWQMLRPPPMAIIEHGDEGEKRLIDELASKLPDHYFSISKLMTHKSLDADVILLGPTGIWILESKYKSGKIMYKNGIWTCEQWYYAAGGIKTSKFQELKPYDKQWLAEKKSIAETISRRLPQDMNWLVNVIKGGIEFDHLFCVKTLTH